MAEALTDRIEAAADDERSLADLEVEVEASGMDKRERRDALDRIGLYRRMYVAEREARAILDEEIGLDGEAFSLMGADGAERRKRLVQEAVLWDPDKHPRNRLGEFIRTIGTLTRGARVTIPRGPTVMRSRQTGTLSVHHENLRVPEVFEPGDVAGAATRALELADDPPEELAPGDKPTDDDLVNELMTMFMAGMGEDPEPVIEHERLRAAFDGFEHGGLRIEMVPDLDDTHASGAVHVQGQILDASRGDSKLSQGVGSIHRSASITRDGELEIGHATLQLDADVQGAGFAAALQEHSLRQYADLGAKRVRVATSNVGGYAWARAGFAFDPIHYYDVDDPPEIEAELAAYRGAQQAMRWRLPAYRDVSEVSDEEWDEFVSRLPTEADLKLAQQTGDLGHLEGKFASESQIAQWGRDRTRWERGGREMWLGKHLMLDANWVGHMRLDGFAVEEGEYRHSWDDMIARVHRDWARDMAAEEEPGFASDWGPDANLYFADDSELWRRIEERVRPDSQVGDLSEAPFDARLHPRDRIGRFTFSRLARMVTNFLGIDPFDVDVDRLEGHVAEHEKEPVSRLDVGSPCARLRDLDFAVHVWLPGVIRERFPDLAHRLVATSPRWGARAHKGKPVALPPPLNPEAVQEALDTMDEEWWAAVVEIYDLDEAKFDPTKHPRGRGGLFVEVLKWARALPLDTYLVGGAVRDKLLGREPKDADLLAAGAGMVEIAAALADEPKVEVLRVADQEVGIRVVPKGIPDAVEIAPPRREVSTGPGRQDFKIVPDASASVEEDLERRDFTVNAIAQSLRTGKLVDPVGGVEDLKAGRLRTITPDSFRDDPLRIMRGLVRVSKDGLEPDEDTRSQMIEWAPRLRYVSGDRIGDEMLKLLQGGPGTDDALRLARDTGVLAHALPELVPMVGFEQESKYHDMTVDEHTFSVVRKAVIADAPMEAKLAALIHDAGKPASAWRGKDGRLHYYENPEMGRRDHAEIGAEIADAVSRRLGYSRRFADTITYLVANHMWDDFRKPKANKARRFIARHGIERARMLLALKRADMGGKGEEGLTDADRGRLDEFEKLVNDNADQPTKIGDLKINGSDLRDLGFEPGPVVGVILRDLLGQVVGQPHLNDREWLLRMARKRRRVYDPKAD